MERCQYVGHGSDGGTFVIHDTSGANLVQRVDIRDNVHHAGWRLLYRDTGEDAGLISNSSAGTLVAVHAGQGRGGTIERNIILGLDDIAPSSFLQYTPDLVTPASVMDDFELIVQDNWIENARQNAGLEASLRRNVFLRVLSDDAFDTAGSNRHLVSVGGKIRLEQNVIAGEVYHSLVGMGFAGELLSRENLYICGRAGISAIGWFITGGAAWGFGAIYAGEDTVLAGEIDSTANVNSRGRGDSHVKWFGTLRLGRGPSDFPELFGSTEVFDLEGRHADDADFGMTFAPTVQTGDATGMVWATHPEAMLTMTSNAFHAAFPSDVSSVFHPEPIGLPPVDLSTGEMWREQRFPTFDPADYGLVACGAADLAAPWGVLDLPDVIALLQAFGDEDPVADYVAPFGQFDIADIVAFLQIFGDGCPG
ncbi:MAG: hypothetical protein CMJ31_13385 [Phycisphaerae bacterium]|nr:hypothetical protein [Phycisphaerae bacterium]